jgi:hypothetical protein
MLILPKGGVFGFTFGSFFCTQRFKQKMSSTKRSAPASYTRSISARTCASNNHCFVSDIEFLDGSGTRKVDMNDGSEDSVRKSPRIASRLIERDAKLTIFKEMFNWKTEGGLSPVKSLVERFKVHRNTPGKIFKKVVRKGTVDNQWHVQGRPPEFTEEVWDGMVEIVREYRESHLSAPARIVRSDLLGRFNQVAPSIRTIRRKKSAIGKKSADAAIRLLGPGPVTLVVDRASCHVSKASKVQIDKWFKIQIQPPRSPDFNLLDASVFPTLERECNKSGAVTHEQIKKAVAKIWKLVTPATMEKAVRKVKRNMAKSVELKGGNYFYD